MEGKHRKKVCRAERQTKKRRLNMDKFCGIRVFSWLGITTKQIPEPNISSFCKVVPVTANFHCQLG